MQPIESNTSGTRPVDLWASGKDGGDAFFETIRQARDLVEGSYGPFGNNVGMAGFDKPLSFDDGYLALRNFRPAGRHIRQEAINRLLEASDATRRDVGDGTSLTAILAAELLLNAWSGQDWGASSRKALSQKMMRYSEDILERIKENTIDIKSLGEEGGRAAIVRAATIAAHGDKVIGEKIGSVVFDVGENALVRAEVGEVPGVEIRKTHGYSYPGATLREFWNDRTGVRYENALLLFINTVEENVNTKGWRTVTDVWKNICKLEGGIIPLVVVSNTIGGTVRGTFARREVPGTGEQLPMAIVAAPSLGNDSYEALKDMAAIFGGRVVSRNAGASLDSLTADWFGRAPIVDANANNVSISYDDAHDQKTAELVAKASFQFKAIESPTDEQRNLNKMRISFIDGAGIRIIVPQAVASHQTQLLETLEDAFRSAQSALKGVVPGGGHFLYWCASKTEDAFMMRVFSRPFTILLEQAGLSGSDVPLKDDPSLSYNVEHGWVPVTESHAIVESAEAVTTAVKNAVQAANVLMNTKYVLEYYNRMMDED